MSTFLCHRSALVHLKWRLHFEFITNDDFKFDVVEGLSQAPDSLNIETMTWNLDIKVSLLYSRLLFELSSLTSTSKKLLPRCLWRIF